MIDVMVAGVIALIVLVGAYQLTNDAAAMSNETYNNLIARVSLLSLEGRWRGLAESDRRRLLDSTSLCHVSMEVLGSWCDELFMKFAKLRRHSEACLRQQASGQLQARIVWSDLGMPPPQCWRATEKSQRHDWR